MATRGCSGGTIRISQNAPSMLGFAPVVTHTARDESGGNYEKINFGGVAFLQPGGERCLGAALCP
jgi:hypothetical protein